MQDRPVFSPCPSIRAGRQIPQFISVFSLWEMYGLWSVWASLLTITCLSEIVSPTWPQNQAATSEFSAGPSRVLLFSAYNSVHNLDPECHGIRTVSYYAPVLLLTILTPWNLGPSASLDSNVRKLSLRIWILFTTGRLCPCGVFIASLLVLFLLPAHIST